MGAINDVVTKFSFVGSLSPQESFNSNLKASVGLLAGMSAALVGSAAGFLAWTTSVTEAIDPMVQLSRETDVAVGTIQELGYAASQNGSDLNAVTKSLDELNKRAGEFSRTGGGSAADAFTQLGVNVNDSTGKMKTADKIMLGLGDSLQKFTKAEQADLLDKLGIDGSLIQLLGQSGDAIDSLRKKARSLGTITTEQADAAAALNDANTTLKFGMQGLKNQIAVGLAPTIQTMVEGFIEFLTAHKDLIKDGVQKLGKALVVAAGFISRMAPVALAAAAAFAAWKLATVALMSPVALIATAIAAVVLIIDDLIVAFNGGESAIRNFILEWTGFDITPALHAAVDGVKSFVGLVFDHLKAVKDLFGGLFSGVADIWRGDFSGGMDKIIDAVMGYVDHLKSIFLSAFSYISEQFDKFIPDFLKDDKEIVVKQVGFSGGNSAAVENGSQTNNYATSSSVKQNNNINVYSSDPNAAGQAVADHSSRQLREANYKYSRGGR